MSAAWPELVEEAAARLGDRREARWMVEEATGGAAPTPRARLRLEEMVRRRVQGEPLQYVLGNWSFRRLELMVDRRVLIPRPETEQVVEYALSELDRMEARHRAGTPRATAGEAAGAPAGRATVVDLGTGSGAIALAIAQERAGVEVWATDCSPAALDVARANLAGLAGLAATRVRLVQGDWFAALPGALEGHVDLLVSNPPYISTAEMAALEPTVLEWEPRLALEAGPVGTEAIEAIVAGAPSWLVPGGVAVIEIAPEQATRARDLAARAGFAEAEVKPDLAGRPRALIARMAPTAPGRPPR